MGNAMLKSLVLIVWIGSMAWLVRYEAFPHRFDDTIQGYRDLSSDLPAMRDSWMKVLSDGQHVGYLNSSVEMADADGREELLLTTKLMLRINIQGEMKVLHFDNLVRLDSRHALVGSESGFFLDGFSGDFILTPKEGRNTFQLQIDVEDLSFARTVTLPEDAIISSPMLEQGLRAVKPGQTLKVRALDPFSMTGEVQTITIRGVSTSTQRRPDESQDLQVTQVETTFGEVVLQSEVDQYGRVLRQQTPFGLTLEMTTSREAMDVPKDQAVDPSDFFVSPLLNSLLQSGQDL